jgi:hypothetical protein
MDDRLFYPLLALAIAAMVALALVWPQGLGRPSPAPFGHPFAPIASPKPTQPPPGPKMAHQPRV